MQPQQSRDGKRPIKTALFFSLSFITREPLAIGLPQGLILSYHRLTKALMFDISSIIEAQSLKDGFTFILETLSRFVHADHENILLARQIKRAVLVLCKSQFQSLSELYNFELNFVLKKQLWKIHTSVYFNTDWILKECGKICLSA